MSELRADKRLRELCLLAPTPAVVVLICVTALAQAALYFTVGAATLAIALTLGWVHR